MHDESLHQPHDKLFKAGFSDPTNAAAFLRGEISPAISTRIDWDQLQLCPGSFVDSHYRHSESDLLFAAPLLETECFIYLLFEHQTTAEPTLALRLLRYMVRIWENHLKLHPSATTLPVILPVVLAQNAEIWKLSPHFQALFDLPQKLAEEIRPYLPDFNFRLIQLASLPFEAICGTPAGIMILRAMKAERVAALLADPVWDEALLVQIPRETLELLLRYILNADIDKAKFDLRVSSIQASETKTTAMTLAQQIRQEGRQEGRHEGRQEAILENLQLRLGSIPLGLRDAIAAIQDDKILHRLHRASIQAVSFEEFSTSL